MGRRRKERNEVGMGVFFIKKKGKISRKEKERQRKHNEQAAKCQRDGCLQPRASKVGMACN